MTEVKKSPMLAFTLNFFVPGAGLWYLGSWAWGLLNLLVVIAIGVTAAFALTDDTFDRIRGPLAAACAGGSGGLAMALVNQSNARLRTGGVHNRP